MAERVRSQYTNLVKLRLDQASLKRTRKQIQGFRAEVAKAMKMQIEIGGIAPPKMPSQPKDSKTKATVEEHKVRQALNKTEQKALKREIDLAKARLIEEKRITNEQNARRKQAVANLTVKGNSGKASQTLFADMLRAEGKQTKAPLQDSHVTQMRNQQKFNELQRDSIDNFMISNKLVRESSEEQKKAIRQQLKQTKNVKELRYAMRKIRGSLSDEYSKRRQLVRQSERQLAVQQRFNSSLTQMVGTFGSVYAITTAIGSSMQIGMQMEAMEKSFKVVSKDSRAAGENMEWVRNEAMRLGSPIMEASKGFASMIAAAGDKMTMKDLRGTFTGIQEAGVALGLSKEDLGGTILAVKQMLSRLLGRVNLLYAGKSY